MAKGREYIWPITLQVRRRFEELAARILDLEDDDPEVQTLEDEIRRLPEFPYMSKPEDTIVLLPVTTIYSTPRRTIQ